MVGLSLDSGLTRFSEIIIFGYLFYVLLATIVENKLINDYPADLDLIYFIIMNHNKISFGVNICSPIVILLIYMEQCSL